MAKPAQSVVLSQEHYHFPPNDSDMVAARPVTVYLKTPTASFDLLCQQAIHDAWTEAKNQASKFGLTSESIQERRWNSTRGEIYRVWVEAAGLEEKVDRFVWVVRVVDTQNV